jgi:hypothetical protein
MTSLAEEHAEHARWKLRPRFTAFTFFDRLVEIVDEAGAPCAAGRAGRFVVTGLMNLAVPLMRYDSDDLVTALDGPCPCGRNGPAVSADE